LKKIYYCPFKDNRQLDGEVNGKTPITTVAIPQAIEIVVPA
jgi:diacylglycerol kinase family enzyme